jgi:hypothetical protein
MHQLKVVFIGILILVIGSGVGYAQEEEFESLFSGEDLSGWVEMGKSGAFSVEDGTLSLSSPENYFNWLRSEQRYENFVLRLEYMVTGFSETGIYLHAPLHGNPVRSGIKIHLRHDQVEEGSRSPGGIYDVQAPITLANKPAGEWNEMEIYVNWPTLKVVLNGTVVQHMNMALDEDLRWRLRKGYIGFEDSGTPIQFRNIRIRELPDKENEWTSLFQGDPSTWDTEGEATWRREGDRILGSGGDGVLRTDRSYESYEYQMYFKTGPAANGGVFYRLKDRENQRSHYEIQVYNVPTATNPTGSIYGLVPATDAGCRSGDWCFMQLISDGAYTRVLINGKTVAKAGNLALPDDGKIGIQNHSQGTIEYKRPRIKQLDGN